MEKQAKGLAPGSSLFTLKLSSLDDCDTEETSPSLVENDELPRQTPLTLSVFLNGGIVNGHNARRIPCAQEAFPTGFGTFWSWLPLSPSFDHLPRCMENERLTDLDSKEYPFQSYVPLQGSIARCVWFSSSRLWTQSWLLGDLFQAS